MSNKNNNSEDRSISDFSSIFTEVDNYFKDSQLSVKSLKSISNPYEDKSYLSEGGMKVIYSCKDLRCDRYIALAELKEINNEEKLKDFLREARITAYLQHPNIMPVYEIGVNKNEFPYFTMKLIRGNDLGEIIREIKEGDPEIIKKFPLSKLLSIFEKCCEAVSYAHSHGVIHLDLKPDNISISNFGEVILCDWGISEPCPDALDDSLAVSEEFKKLIPLIRNDDYIRGTIPFMAPEQINRELAPLSPACDIYSLGMLLYVILCHNTPFKSTSEKEDLVKVLEADFPYPSEKNPNVKIPKSLEAVCMKAINYETPERYESVDCMLDDLRRFKDGYATEAEEASAFEIIKLLYLRNKSISWTVILSVILIIAITSQSMLKIKQSESKAIKERNKAIEANEKTLLLLNQVKSEQQQKLLMAERAALKYLNNAKTALYFKNYSKADEHIETVWELGAHVDEVKMYYALYRVAQLKTEEALPLLTSLKIAPFLIQSVRSLNDNRAVDDIVKISGFMQKQNYRHLISYFLHNSFSLFDKHEDKMKLLKMEIEVNNRDVKNFSFLVHEKGVELDISGNSINYPGSLELANIIGLNISNSNFRKAQFLPINKLEELNITNTQIEELKPSSSLRKLVMKNCKFRSFSSFDKMKSLEYLDIRGVENFPISKLYRLPKLKEVLLDKKLFTKELEEKAKFKIKVN